MQSIDQKKNTAAATRVRTSFLMAIYRKGLQCEELERQSMVIDTSNLSVKRDGYQPPLTSNVRPSV